MDQKPLNLRKLACSNSTYASEEARLVFSLRSPNRGPRWLPLVPSHCRHGTFISQSGFAECLRPDDMMPTYILSFLNTGKVRYATSAGYSGSWTGRLHAQLIDQLPIASACIWSCFYHGRWTLKHTCLSRCYVLQSSHARLLDRLHYLGLKALETMGEETGQAHRNPFPKA